MPGQDVVALAVRHEHTGMEIARQACIRQGLGEIAQRLQRISADAQQQGEFAQSKDSW
jgi:hypothetical protein